MTVRMGGLPYRIAMLYQLFFLAFYVSPISAVAFRFPRATFKAEIGDLVFPPKPTPAPPIPRHIFQRQSGSTTTFIVLEAPDNTCGFISGLSSTNAYALAKSGKC